MKDSSWVLEQGRKICRYELSFISIQ